MTRGLALALLLGALAWPSPAGARDWPSWLEPCGSNWRCGTFTVPLDRTDLTEATIGLNVRVLPAQAESARAPEALVAIAGGPGGASTELANWVAATFVPVAFRRDIVLVDQRGTGASGPLFCPFPGLITPASSAERIRAYWAACLGELGADPRHYTTAVAVDDLDDLREALGYPRVDLYGPSYGATAVQYYLLRHGDRVRTAIFDGGTLLDVPIFERYARTSQTMLDRLFARCARQVACHRAFPSPSRDLRTVLTRLERSPVSYRGMSIDKDAFANAVQYLSRKPDSASLLPLVLRRAARDGVPSVIPRVQRLVPAGATDASVMSWAIQCLEPWARRDIATTRRLGQGTYLGPTMTRAAEYASAVCSAMPDAADVPGTDRRVPSPVPTLVLVGGQDPQDPLENVANVTSVMPAARVVVVRGAGHGAINHGCAEDLANAFVTRGSALGMDVSCAARAPLTPFALR